MVKNTLLAKPEHIIQRRQAIHSFKAKINAKRSATDVLADFLASLFGTIAFLIANAVAFIVWILWNSGYFGMHPGIDPYPFGFLTMFVSLEAIFLAIIVLISQNRAARIVELRDELDLYINTYSEVEITKIIYLLTLLLEKQGIDISQDEDLGHMLKTLETDKIESDLAKQL